MKKTQDILVRNKRDTMRLSNQMTETLKISRQENLNDAIQYNNTLYINILLDNVSILVIIRLLAFKVKKGLNQKKK